MAEQPDRGSNRRHVARAHGNGQQYSGSLHPAGQPLSATVTLDQQGYRDGGPHQQQTNPRPSRRKHEKEPLHLVKVRYVCIAA
jgi:hypothetical protein